ncbi:hypothetical protein [Nevskia sp.]|uniref:hypothetical protein n=1 Tax=Nevskia sp. TaxID=1929292 RepID=UPI0025FC4474|nr:hypothetical protein [Nevskia sp.]
MKVWELRNGLINETAQLIHSSANELHSGMFDVEGRPLAWRGRPSVEFLMEKRKKKQKPRADIMTFVPGVLVLNEKAFAALQDFLSRFGQLLEMSCEGGYVYFYNVTNLLDCVDAERSEKRSSGSIFKEAFLEDAIPDVPTVFKDSLTARTRIYVNQSAKESLEKRIADAALSGAQFVMPGVR